MRRLPKNWRTFDGRPGSYRALHRWRNVRSPRGLDLRRLYRVSKWPAVTAIATFAIAAIFSLSPFSAIETVKHIAASPNCDAARMVGLAPARRGQPGYWLRHDRDRDGIACEPWPRR